MAAGLMGGCSSSDVPTNEVFMLVDLSETWLNPASADRNKAVLEEVGEGIFAASEMLTPPMAVQYRIIGDASYERPPICDAVYKPMLVNTAKKRPDWLVTRPKKLERLLGVDCPAALLARAPEPLTEISAAIASIASKPRPAGARRTMIVMSDFLEEAAETTSLADFDFKNVRVLLLYRPLARETAVSTRQRVTEWRDLLQGRGATVTVWPDTALKRADVANYLTQR
jgi:hypothetical protein